VPRPADQLSKDHFSEDLRALLAIFELMQSKLLSPPTLAYLSEVRDMLQEEITKAQIEPAPFPRLKFRLKGKLAELRQDQQDLEHLRWLISPEHWPRIYSVLQQVREEMKRAEQEVLLQKRA